MTKVEATTVALPFITNDATTEVADLTTGGQVVGGLI
jgi:hypothetical protein